MSNVIMVVDDEPDIVHLVQFVLQRAGYTVRTASTGMEAMTGIAEQMPDLLVCDIMMPEMDGMEVLRRIRADPHTESLPVIMLTARCQNDDVAEAWREGADLFLPKPFSPAELLSFVSRILPGGVSMTPHE